MTLPLAAIDSGWVAAIGTLTLGVAAVGAIWADRRWRLRQERKKEAEDRAEVPSRELSAASVAAESIARAAASLIAPFQETIANMQQEHGALREAVTVSRAAEEQCKRELNDLRAEHVKVQSKLREVTDRLGIPPNGDAPT
jgi:phage shock protein A